MADKAVVYLLEMIAKLQVWQATEKKVTLLS